jgi:2-(1,2-epoxy-1,2-dihydrophenyl)acetyl-CoA isomerase
MAVEVEQQVKLEIEGGVAWIRLSRPEKLNAIGSVMRQQLADAIKQAERDDVVRVLVLTGSGRAFSAGGDIGEMDQGMDARTPDELGRILRDEYGAMFIRLRTMPKPVIAALNGPALGIGASFALACDIRIGTPDAYLTEAFINIGLVMEGGASYLLPRLAGLGVAFEMFCTGQPLSAADAHRLGLINRIVPADRLEQEVRDLANHIASQPRQALAGAKKAVNRALQSSYEEAVEFESYLQEGQVANGEFPAGVQKFLAGRARK